jgi:hypothetical protein
MLPYYSKGPSPVSVELRCPYGDSVGRNIPFIIVGYQWRSTPGILRIVVI